MIEAGTAIGLLVYRADPAIADDVLAEVFLVCSRRFEEVPAQTRCRGCSVASRALGTQRRARDLQSPHLHGACRNRFLA